MGKGGGSSHSGRAGEIGIEILVLTIMLSHPEEVNDVRKIVRSV
jgi:hypothetical protein